MNYDRLAVYCDVSPNAVIEVSLPTVADYLAFLYRIARTGGHTPEEEIFVENLAAAMEVESTVLQNAVRQSQNRGEGVREAAVRLRATPLRESAYFDACHLVRLDREVSAEERHALAEAAAGLGLSRDFVETAGQLAARQERFLHAFCLLADQPDPLDLWPVYLQEGLRQSDRQRRIILPDPDLTPLDERIAVLALILKLAGVGWRRSAKESVVQNLSRFLELGTPDQDRALLQTWSLASSLQGLADCIQSRPLQLIALGDAYRVCLSDTQISDFERILLDELARNFGLDPALTEQFIELTYDEAAFRESVRQLSQPSPVVNR